MTLEEKLEVELSMVYQNDTYPEDAVEKIKQAFIDEGWITPEQSKQTQELVNHMANLANDMAKLPVTVREIGSMTGAEWYERLEKELNKGLLDKSVSYLRAPGYLSTEAINEAARRASGIEEDE